MGSFTLKANKLARMNLSRPIRSLRDILAGSLTLKAIEAAQMFPTAKASTDSAPHSLGGK